MSVTAACGVYPQDRRVATRLGRISSCANLVIACESPSAKALAMRRSAVERDHIGLAATIEPRSSLLSEPRGSGS